MNQSNGLKPSSIEEIRKKAEESQVGEYVKLPSGLVLKLKRPSFSKLLKDKKIPNHLVSAAIRVNEAAPSSSASELSENIQLMEAILLESIIEPEGMTQQDIESLSDEDKGTCFIFVQKGVTELDSFRRQSTSQTDRPDLPEVSGDKAKSPSKA